MRGIPLTRVSQCFPFVKFLNQIGSPTEKLLKQVGLPFFEVKQSNNLIPEYSVWSLVEQAARWEGMEDFGLQVGMRTELEDVGLFAQSLLSSSTLHDTLNKFVNHITAISQLVTILAQDLFLSCWVETAHRISKVKIPAYHPEVGEHFQ